MNSKKLKILESLDAYNFEEAADLMSLKTKEDFSIEYINMLINNKKLTPVIKVENYRAWPLINEIMPNVQTSNLENDVLNYSLSHHFSPLNEYIAEINKEVLISGFYYYIRTKKEKWYLKSINGDSLFTPFNIKYLSLGVTSFSFDDMPFPEPPVKSQMLILKTDIEKLLSTENINCEKIISTVNDQLPSRLLAVAALLDVLKNEPKKNHTQDSIIIAITENKKYRDVDGLSRRNLETIFSEANKAMKEKMKG
ncbi:hypothetical protein [Vreelandella neptunia]|uniref:Uncharacterized protein n=1 Tax=Vreelandella neptunia TaxID=115551 RepID=A0ABZ0YM36_9GAMM|nr:hypothetical protein [Halomonas neptunia]MDN3562014.1 hypothetical protein [Halomonas neptunia]WQH13199.1 hypothetical protein SR894_01305 [Halomonas neptunia]